MSELRVLTWLWNQPGGRMQFTVDHVAIWAAMVRRHLHMPHRIACVTDLDGLPSHIERIEPPHEFEDVRIPTWREERPQCLRRISMFRPDAAAIFGDRFVCMDLDVVIADDITPMFTNDEFRIAKGTAAGRPYNGSMMLIQAGKRARVYQEFTPEKAVKAGQQFVGSDQAWISYCLGPKERVWSGKDGLCWYRGEAIADPRIMFFPGNVKPWTVTALGESSFVEAHFQGDRTGRCLVLGYDATLWDDVERAIARPFHGVIASPEAAAHWPGPVLEVASNNYEAVRLARMHGFDDLALCGMEEAA